VSPRWARGLFSKRFSAKGLKALDGRECVNIELNCTIRGVFDCANFIANFASMNFFFFLVRRYSARFASTAHRKTLPGCEFVRWSEAIWTEFRRGDGT
jgi:hypothetical protein